MPVVYTTAEIAALVGAQRIAGTSARSITDIASLTTARAGDLSFLGNARYKAQVAATAATAVLLPLDYTGEPQAGQVFIHVENPSAALARVCARIEQGRVARRAVIRDRTLQHMPEAIQFVPNFLRVLRHALRFVIVNVVRVDVTARLLNRYIIAKLKL